MPTLHAPWVQALGGGILIGLASLLVMFVSGKVAGISGIFSRVIYPRKDEFAWRAVFLFGLIAGAGVAFAWSETAAIFRPVGSLGTIGLAGLLVGFGTRIGRGCTSGHGVCGVGLGAKSSIVATVLFVIAGMATVFVLRHSVITFAP